MNSEQRNTHIEQALTAVQSGNGASAETHCAAILENNDQDAEAWSILGMALIGTAPQKAFNALQKAVNLEPAEPRWCIHFGLGLKMLGQMAQAEQVFARAAKISGGADDAVLAWSECLMQMGQVDKASAALKDAANNNGSAQIWLQYSNVLSAANDSLAAVKARETAFAGREMPREEMLSIANMHVLLSQYGAAQSYVDKLLSANTDDTEAVLLGANLLRWQGDLDQAHDILRNAYAGHKDNGALLLAILDLNRSEDAGLTGTAKSIIKAGRSKLSERRGLAFVLARRADKAGAYDEAWDYVRTANKLYDDGAVSEAPSYRKQLEAGLALYAAVENQTVEQDAGHIYVIGPPRSGGSLLQTILAAHPGVASVGERGALMAWFLPILDKCRNTEEAVFNWQQVAEKLPMSDTAGMRSTEPGAQIFVDKMPHHAHVAGLLERIHPSAKFVNVRRDPFDMAMSIYLHDFTDKFGYSRNITDIANYLKFQNAAVQAWAEAGVPIITHDHGAFLEAPENAAASLFGKLNLTWRDEYLEPEKRQSTVRTFSALQVRSKVTKAYSGRGQNYMGFMGGAVEILQSI
ncbi:MAG: sulfotransferase [Robiginitomaculum sp.]|nr:sulfotransferase [Robiginitomaculum sp.]